VCVCVYHFDNAITAVNTNQLACVALKLTLLCARVCMGVCAFERVRVCERAFVVSTKQLACVALQLNLCVCVCVCMYSVTYHILGATYVYHILRAIHMRIHYITDIIQRAAGGENRRVCVCVCVCVGGWLEVIAGEFLCQSKHL
jgi:hypothetical protein